MKSKLTSLVISLVLAGFFTVNGQTDNSRADKYTLLTMPYIQRPLTLYRGQFQVNTGYKFAVRSKAFDNSGNIIALKKDGNSSVLHYYFLDLKYGITDFIEVGVETNFMKRGIRAETVSYLSASNTVTVNSLTEYKGMGDALVYASFRPPWEYKWFDVSLGGGMFLPTASAEPKQPTHTYVADALSTNSYTVNYHFNNRNGFGVPVYIINASGKITFSKFAAEAGFSFRDPVKEGNNIRWEQTLVAEKFSYYDKPYQYLLDRTLMFNFSVHYQPTGWFNIYMNGSYSSTSKGWTEYWGQKYRNPEMKLFVFEPGFEIQISPSLTIYQIAGMALSGKNADASFNLFSTLSYNIFPFRK